MEFTATTCRAAQRVASAPSSTLADQSGAADERDPHAGTVVVLLAAAAVALGCGGAERPAAQTPPERRAARTVVVPETDRTPPTASIRAGDPGRTGRLRATAIARDDDGGTGRVRLSLTYVVRCGDRARRITEHRPPAQIAAVRLAPGTPAPVQRTRSATLRLRAGPGCTADGAVFAEATNAHGLQAVSHRLRFRYEAPSAGA
jgi:hypothetical protein